MPMPTENILGYQVIQKGPEQCVDLIGDWLNDGNSNRVFICVNPHSLVESFDDKIFQLAIHGADLATPDGAGIVLASKILGGSIRERVTGSDIFWGLSARLNQTGGKSYFFLGSTEETLAAIKKKMASEYSNIAFAGAYSPPYKPEFSEEDNKKMVKAVNAASPDVLWVGMTAPKQEKWIYQNKDRLDVKFIGAVGAVFDFYVGNVKRSHPVFQKMGLEWLPRLLQRPGLLWNRMIISAPRFLFYVLKQRFKMTRASCSSETGMKTPSTVFRLNPETGILLDACRLALGISTQNECAPIVSSINGDRLLFLANKHMVLRALYEKMVVTGWRGISDKTRQELLKLYGANVIWSHKAIKSLQRVTEVLALNKIDYMTFKGPGLSETAYGDPYQRSFVDIDLLVPRQKVIDAVRALSAADFKPEIILSQKALSTYVHWEYFLPLVDKISGTSIELHWELTGHYGAKAVEMTDMLTESALLLGQDVCVPKIEGYLVYLCLHGAHHRWEQIDSICCVAGLVQQHPDLEWGLVMEVAEEWRCRRKLSLGLFLAKTFMGLTLPEDVNAYVMDDPAVVLLAREVVGRWNESGEADACHGPWMRFSSFHMKVREQMLDRLRYAFRLAFRPTIEDFRRQLNRNRSLHLLPIQRPLRLVRDLSRTLLQRG